MHFFRFIPAGVIFAALLTLPAFAQSSSDPSRPAADTTNTARQDRDYDRNYSWIGLLGLAGLGGLMRRRQTHDRVADDRHPSRA
jgi:MYXO-CTERM domain-containing protein